MSTELPPTRRDSEVLQILATEHWSLLATRALTYQESLGRVNMFLTILSGAVIALALVAQADRFGPTFVTVAIFMLTVVFFTGIATIRRLLMLNRDDYKWVVGMNRLRHGYLELHPELEPNFITSPYDDLAGALKTLGLDPVSAPTVGTMFHAFVTLPGMLGVIVASVGGAIASEPPSTESCSPARQRSSRRWRRSCARAAARFGGTGQASRLGSRRHLNRNSRHRVPSQSSSRAGS